MIDWSKYPNFSKYEFDCKETGKNEITPEFMGFIQSIRTSYNKPITVTSGYRDKTHSIEINKSTIGEHTLGLCADIKFKPEDLAELIYLAYTYGVTRVGIDFKKQFLHLGIATAQDGKKETSWGY